MVHYKHQQKIVCVYMKQIAVGRCGLIILLYDPSTCQAPPQPQMAHVSFTQEVFCPATDLFWNM